jgi:hypothetical protein
MAPQPKNDRRIEFSRKDESFCIVLRRGTRNYSTARERTKRRDGIYGMAECVVIDFSPCLMRLGGGNVL